MILYRIFLALALMVMFASQAQSQQFAVGDKDDEGRTYLYDEPLEGVYSNNWSGMRVGGDGSDQTDVHVRSDGKTVFEGIMSINCASQSGYSWTLNGEEAEYSVPQEVIKNTRVQFCASTCDNQNAPGLSYMFKDPSVCRRVRYVCETDQVPFSNDCGCGCMAGN